ncbi:hypothetical protein [Streptomyces endophytica]|uniref:Resolvase/invertase-type recombinase catalytic domain-containing protein n=1 Tax=Streptomyces endophytica TaxID=2991496 RepID=A0ABY6PAX3_9ACTN|nr:hypothetical protein [Streptomyces endophytica]UZJ30620.1 hypothetical protein OJ254_09945 [Streptomyces endophytica]
MTETSTPAVLYICAERSQDAPGVAHKRAVQEGRDFAVRNGLHIVAEVSDPYGEPVPQRRAGWMRVREMAERGEVGVVITRWPNALSQACERRYPELDHLGRHGAQLFFSWAPLSAMAGVRSTR